MPSTTEILHMRQRRREQASRNPTGRLGLGCSLTLALLAVLAAVGLSTFYSSLAQDLPSAAALPALLEPPGGLMRQPTRLYDRSGEFVLLNLENPGAAGATYLALPVDEDPGRQSLQSLQPANLISATLASADPNFWRHNGVDWQNLSADNHPTLAQQLVSDVLLWDERPSLRRALRERLLAVQATERFGRTKLLEWYLNSAHYGPLVYGADAAARLYFSRPAAELSLGQAAWLAAAAQSPQLAAQWPAEEQRSRRDAVIDAMLAQGRISAKQAQAARREPLDLNDNKGAPITSLAPEFTDLALEQLAGNVNQARLERGGLRVITSLDLALQRQVDCAARAYLTQAEDPETSPANEQDPTCPAAAMLPGPPPAVPDAGRLGASIVVLDPTSGQILALTGAPDATSSPAALPGRPAGTLLTPFVYLTAFTRGLSPSSLAWDIPTGEQDALSQNFDGRYHGPMRLRMALANDYMPPARELLTGIGPENVWRTARQLGLWSLPENAGPGVFTEGKITLLEASQAMGVFAHGGQLAGQALSTGLAPEGRLNPSAILSVQTRTGQTWLDWSQPQSQLLISPQLAYLVTDSLRDEVARWPSLGHPNLLELERPAAVKLGRTWQGEDSWTVGYTPQRVVGVWTGRNSTAPQTSGASQPLPPELSAGLWHAIMQYAHQDLPSQDWSMPPGVMQVQVCDPSGMLPTEACPATVTEVFLDGSQPTQPDRLFYNLQINRETGRLATVFTPAEMIEEHTYLDIPQEALDWAKTAGIDLPPEQYDLIPVTAPDMFAYVSGQLPVRGSAGGEGFAFYRLQVGQGLNPQRWIQIGEQQTQPVEDGALGLWDTQELNGLYVLQLRVVDEDQRVETAVVQVMVDNTLPQVRALYPTHGETVSATSQGIITLSAEASDNLALESVSFWVDGRLTGTRSQPPFTAAWTARPGAHTLKIQALDRAGNTQEEQIEFTVK